MKYLVIQCRSYSPDDVKRVGMLKADSEYDALERAVQGWGVYSSELKAIRLKDLQDGWGVYWTTKPLNRGVSND